MGGSASAGFGKLIGFGAGAVAIVGGLNTIKSAVASTFKIGMDFQSTINNLGAVTSSTGAVLEKVSAKARQLGSDIDLPAASASDAAAAMLELAKGGLSVQQSMDAAKGTLTLAAAAQIDGASAATIQSAALNTFGLSADKAGHVADVLANTANAASGSITDFAAGMQQSGSVAAAFGISLDSTATVLGLFAKNGIIGSDAGTSFKTMLTQLAAPTKVAQLAMDDLGLSVYDANGNFVGAEELTNQLAKAQGRLSQQQFNTAATTVFGSDALRGANILAKEGVKGYDAMAGSVSKVGGAQEVAAAQTKGLKGALGLVKNAVQDVQLKAFDKLAPSVESAVRKVAGAIPGIADVVLPVFSNIVDGATGFFSKVSDIVGAFGPDNVKSVLDGGVKISGAVQSAFHDAFSDETLKFISDFGTQFVGRLVDLAGVVTKAAGDFVAPIISGVSTLAGKALPFVTTFVDHVSTALGTAVKAFAPLGTVVGDLFKSLSNSGVLDTFGTALDGVGKAAEGAAKLLVPLVGAVSGILNGFSSLPGQVQGPLLALVAVFALSGPLGRIGTGIKSAMQTAYLNTLYGVDRIRGTMTAGIAGIAAAGKGLLAAFGGPLGLAIVGITTFLSFLPQLIGGNKDAANATNNNVSAVNALAEAFKNSNGLIDENVRQTALAQLQNSEWGASSKDLTTYATNLKNVGVTTRDLVDAELGIPGAAAKIEDAYNRQRAALLQTIEVNRKGAQSGGKNAAAQNDAANAAYASLTILDQQHGAIQKVVGAEGEATAKWKANEDAVRANTAANGDLVKANLAILDSLPDYMKNAQDIDRAGRVTASSFTTVGAAAKSATTDTGAFYKIVGQSGTDAGHPVTAMSQAFDLYNTKVSEADTTTQLFIFTMDKLAGRNVSVEDAMAANATAARALGKSYRDAAANAQAYADAQAKLADDKRHLNDGTDKATNASQIAADERAVKDAYDQTQSSINGVNETSRAYQKTAVLRVDQVFKDVDASKGFAAAVRASSVELKAQRDAFIAQQPAADIASGAAGKLADKYGLIPKNIMTILTADPKLAMEAFADAQKTLKGYSGNVDRLPREVKTIFNAEVAVAEKNGQRLYRVYNSTTGKWEAKFETPTAATAQIAAKKTVQQYDRATGTWTATFATPNQAAAKGVAIGVVNQYNKARGTWTANLLALDKASKPIDAVKASLDGIHNKVVTLEVRQSGTSGEIVYKAPSGQQFQASGGYISGAGTGTSDSIPAWLSNGEYVVKASQTAKHRPLLESINSGAEKFATGGMVGSLGRRQIDMIATGANPGVSAASAVSSLYKQADAAVSAAKAAAIAAAAAAEAARTSASGSASGQDPSAFGWSVGKNIVPFSFQGIPFPSGVAGGTESIWSSFLSELAPIIPGGIRPGEDWGYENRDNVNSPGKKSFHAYGLALDVNSSENPNTPGTSGPAGSGMYQIPSAAGPLAHKYNMEWGADWGDAMHFELHQPPAGFAAASAAAGVGAGAQSGSGVERWRALATKVARAKGEDISSVQVMLNQMSRESSGNPRAINLTDSNAQAGHPSVGLLQFIPSTFAANADPGFNTDIYDPESQMRAWYHYINGNYGGYQKFGQRGYGAYADGGLVRGAGSGRSDSNLAMVSNGEYIVNASSTSRHLPLLHSINGYANGGIVGPTSQLGLSGRSSASVGPELSNVVSALADIAQAVRDARDAVAGQRDAEVAAFSVLNAAKRLQYENQRAAQNVLKAARDKQGTENAKTSARERLVDRQKITAAERVLSRTVAADRAAVGKADREYQNARRTALSYEAAARAAEKFQASQQRAYRAQQQRAAQLDSLTDRLGSASEKLNGLRSDRASLASGLASSVSGFDGGITGHNDTRTTFATILKGQQYNAAQAQKFNVDITKLRALGLSNASLNSIASAGVDGGGVTAAALAKASPKQIKQLNGTVDQMRRIGINVGNVVGGAFYDAGIQAAAGLVKGIQSQMAAIQKVMNNVAGAVVAALVRRLKIQSPSKVMEGHGFNTVQGYINGIEGRTPGVTKAIENMVAVPALPNMTAVRNSPNSSAGIPKIEVQVLLDGHRIDDRVDIKINGFATDFERSLDKVGSQA